MLLAVDFDQISNSYFKSNPRFENYVSFCVPNSTISMSLICDPTHNDVIISGAYFGFDRRILNIKTKSCLNGCTTYVRENIDRENRGNKPRFPCGNCADGK